MGRPAKTYAVLAGEGRSHRTKSEMAARKSAEESLLTGERMRESAAVKADSTAHSHWLRVKKLMAAIGRDDAIHEQSINRYCLMLAECEKLSAERARLEREREEIMRAIDGDCMAADFMGCDPDDRRSARNAGKDRQMENDEPSGEQMRTTEGADRQVRPMDEPERLDERPLTISVKPSGGRTRRSGGMADGRECGNRARGWANAPDEADGQRNEPVRGWMNAREEAGADGRGRGNRGRGWMNAPEEAARWEELAEKLFQRMMKIDAAMEKKRAMLLSIEKENLLTVASGLRAVPKKPPEEEADPMAEMLTLRARG